MNLAPEEKEMCSRTIFIFLISVWARSLLAFRFVGRITLSDNSCRVSLHQPGLLALCVGRVRRVHLKGPVPGRSGLGLVWHPRKRRERGGCARTRRKSPEFILLRSANSVRESGRLFARSDLPIH
ncbi:hypothetical protein BJV77DRAFT_362896 [Russula vinacea]|nr:hypothetical protein BJV77DRAFT_362896 [Russula vinacea]